MIIEDRSIKSNVSVIGAGNNTKQKSHFTDLEEQYKEQSSAYYSTARLWDDGIIDPLETRKVLALGIDASLYAPLEEKSKGIYRM